MLLEKYLQLAIRAHYGTSFVPETRGQQYIKDFSEELQSDLVKLAELGGDASDYQARFERHFTAWLSAKSNCISTMITGGSNFPVRRAEKASRSEQNRWEELKAFREKYFERLRRDLRREARANVDPIQEMREKIEAAEKQQEMMKAANKIVKSYFKDIEAGVEKMQEIGIPEQAARQLFKPDCFGRFGFTGYLLTNNNANIRRMRERLAELEKKQTAETKEVKRADGVRVVENTEADRLQIFFPGKPDSTIVQNLKSRGFKWSPSNGCWQRQLTDNARYSLRHIFS